MSIIRGPHQPLDVIKEVRYSNHSHSVSDSLGNVFSAFTVQRINGSQDVAITRRQHGTGVYTLIATFDQLTYGKQGQASLAVVGQNLVVLLSARDSLNQTLPQEWIVTGVANLS